MSAFVPIFGDTLIDKDGSSLKTAEYLDGKVVLAYTSAHWCPPCRKVTPMLAEIVPKLVDSGKNVAFVFLSSDKTEQEFDDYRKGMPGPAVPFSERQIKAKFSAQHKINGIPNIVVLDSDGSTISGDGVQAVLSDPEGSEFPWKPETPAETLSKAAIIKTDGTQVSFDDIKGKKLGLYFSASWCPPCRAFSPKLKEAYNGALADGQNLEIIYIPSDRDEGSFQEYFGSMPWLSIKLDDKRTKSKLAEFFQVSGIPRFVMVDEDFSIINNNARGAVESGGAKGFPWAPAAVPDVNEDDVGEELNGGKCLVLLAEYADDADQEEAFDALKSIVGNKRPKEGEILYSIAKQEGGISKQIRKLCKIEQSEDIQAILLDLSNGQYYSTSLGDANEDAIKAFVQGCESGATQPTKL